MADDRQAPFPQSGALADRIAQQLARVGKSSQMGVFVIPPGESRTFKATGSFFYVIDATTGLKARLDGQPYVDVRAGSSLKAAQGAFFEWVEMLNEATLEITVKVYGGFAEYRDERLFTLEPLTDTLGNYGGQIPALEYVEVIPSTAPNVIRRKALMVVNKHATVSLEIRDANDGRLDTVLPRSRVVIESHGKVKIANDDAVENVPVTIGEVYWVFYPFPVVAGPPD